MPRVFVEGGVQAIGALELGAAAARHVQVLRLQPGDALTLFDGRGGEWTARVERMGRSAVAVHALAHVACEREARRAVELAIVMPANDRMDGLVEKATELGVARIVPLVSARSVVRLDSERAARRVAHWQAIAAAACEQCGRNRVPAVAPVTPLALHVAAGGHVPLLLSTAEGSAPLTARLAALGPTQACSLLCGPEGGFAPAELLSLEDAGWDSAGLGPRVLRADTAALAALALATLEA